MANATIYENGAIFPFAPDVLKSYNVSCWNHRMERHVCGKEDALPLSVALKASASFPVLIPATILTTARPGRDRYLRLADGGQADNLGVLTAIDLLKKDQGPSRKVLLIVDAYPGTDSPYTSTPRSALPLPVFRRAAEIALDSFHGHHLSFVKALAESANIEVVSLSFDDLWPEGERDPVPGCEKLVDPPLGPPKLSELSQSARSVGTSLRIEPSAAHALADAARAVVAGRCGDIVKALRR